MKNKNGTYPCFFSQGYGDEGQYGMSIWMKVNMEVIFFKENNIIKTQRI